MSTPQLQEIADLIARERDTLLSRWRTDVSELASARMLDEPALTDHIPNVLDELADALRTGDHDTIADAMKKGSSPIHGIERFEHDFDVEEVVAEYDILRIAIHDLVEEHGLSLQGEPFRILSRVLDGAIGAAVRTYAARQALAVQKEREEYLAFVAHDLRGPLHSLTTAISVLELTISDGAKDPDTTRLLETFRKNIGNLADLADMVLEENVNVEAAEGDRPENREFALFPFVEAVVEGFEPVAKLGNTRVRNEVPEDLRVQADPRLLGRILQNLVLNALTYARGAEVTLGANQVEGFTECWVRDTGTGIPKAVADHIFDPDASARPGIGLTIVERFVEAQGGTVAMETEEGAGSTFRFTLPRD